MKTLYTNANIYDSDVREFIEGELCVEDGYISYIAGGLFASDHEGVEVVDLGGAYLVPGLVDVHSHGRAHGDFTSADDKRLAQMLESYVHSGVTSVMATLATAPMDELMAAIDRIGDCDTRYSSALIGIHLEGRYLNPKFKGAHAEWLLAKPDAGEIAELVAKMSRAGLVHVSAALELDEGGEFLRALLERGATVGLAHTGANFDEAEKAFASGAVSLTHTFNAMTPIHHRDGGVITAAVNNDEVYCELIADGFHVAPQVVKLLYNMKGDRTVLITDSMEATGCPDGEYSIAGLPVTVKDGKARTHEGAIAGSTLSLIDGVKNFCEFAGVRFEDALYCATASPAIMVGAYESVGSLDVGKRANMLVLDGDYNVEQVILDGNRVK